MIKSELVQHISTSNPHLYQRDVENIVNAILSEIVAAMSRGDRVELRGFGAFSVKNRPARTGRNPRTGAHVSVGAEVGAVLQDRQGNARAAEQDAGGVIGLAVLTRPSLEVMADSPSYARSPARRRLKAMQIDTELPCARSSPSLILVPLAIVIVMFAVANREIITVSFDPFDSAHPALALQDAAVHADLRAGGRRRRGRRHRGLAAAAQMADAGAAGRSRGARSAGPARRRASRAATCRRAGGIAAVRGAAGGVSSSIACASSPPTRSTACCATTR